MKRKSPENKPGDEVIDAKRWEEVEEGIELIQIGEFENALQELSTVAEVNPANEYAHYFLGVAYYELKDHSRALKCYVKAIDAKPHYIGAMIGAGQSLRLLGDHDRALRMGQQVLRIKKEDPDALYLVGLVHFQRGETMLARAALERFAATGPEAEVAMEVEGLLQVLRGEAQTVEDGGEEPPTLH